MLKKFPTFVAAVLFLFSTLVYAQDPAPIGGVVPPKPPTAEQIELTAAEEALRLAKESLTTAKTQNAETVTEYTKYQGYHLSALKDRQKSEKKHNLFADLPATYAGAPTVARLTKAKADFDTAQAALIIPPGTTPISLALANPTPAEAVLIAAYNKADSKWTQVKKEAQLLRLLVKLGPTDKAEKDEYAAWRYRLEAPDSWTVEMVLEAIYQRDLEYEERMAAKLAELKPAYDAAVKAIAEAEAAVKAAQETRDRISGNVKIEKIGEKLEDVTIEVRGVKTSLNELNGKFDTLTAAIAEKRIASQAEAEAMARLLTKIDALMTANALNADAIAKLQTAQQIVTYAPQGQGYMVCKRNRCWAVAQ